MSLPKFIIGLLFVVTVVGVWSYLDSAAVGVTLLRVVACALILQIGYFLVVCLMVLRNRPESARAAPDAGQSTGAQQAAEKLSAGRSSRANPYSG